METKSANSGQDQAWTLENDKATLQMLGHILSPLELEALKHNNRSFTYNFGGIPITVEGAFGKTLMISCLSKISLLSEILIRQNFNPAADMPRYKKFLSSKITSHDLPTYIKNNLRRQGCTDLLDVMNLGRKKILRARGMGKSGVKVLEKLFEENGCAMLFV